MLRSICRPDHGPIAATIGVSAARSARAEGFSLVEILMVVGVVGIAMAMAVPSVGSAIVGARADGGMRAVAGHLRAARDVAMTQRRTVEVQFVGTDLVRSVRIDGVNRTTLSETRLEGGARFALTPGVPDTPDAFGNARAVDFGGPTTIWFLSDGSAVDATNLPVSGSVFLGTNNRLLAARAVTVLGPTGRIATHRYDSRAWR